MQYVAPLGAADPNAGYVDANPVSGIEGSPVGAQAIEHPMREIVNVIKTALGAGAPSSADLTQLYQAIGAMIANALGAIATPPLFDNDTSPATTAFVQRALGNSAGADFIAASQTLTTAHFGKTIGVGAPGGAITVTLPAVTAGIPAGARLTFLNTSANLVTIQRNTTDLIFVSGSSVTSLVLSPGDTLVLETRGAGTWYAVGGSAQLAYSSVFGSSMGLTGWKQLPGGFIMQWSTLTTSSGGSATFTFPIAFPTARLSEGIGALPGNYTVVASGGGTTSRSYGLNVASSGAAAGSGLSFQVIVIGN